ncbi:MAG: hypothetical protein NTU76_02760 [Candidatus Taylorbacteria bacterium]|nr:hypothetical protein [Candidatus Taylorbacteria bacterium]
MSKFIGMLVAVLVVAMVTGCATTIQFGSENSCSLSGDVPKVGQVINIIGIVSREAPGPSEQLVVWEAVDTTAGLPKVLVATGYNIALKDARGQYLVRNDVETAIKLTKLER